MGREEVMGRTRGVMRREEVMVKTRVMMRREVMGRRREEVMKTIFQQGKGLED